MKQILMFTLWTQPLRVSFNNKPSPLHLILNDLVHADVFSHREFSARIQNELYESRNESNDKVFLGQSKDKSTI